MDSSANKEEILANFQVITTAISIILENLHNKLKKNSLKKFDFS